jgi:biopolymer transport protein ExbD
MKANLPDLGDDHFDLTPMIDIVFMLIFFFMVVAAEITEKIEVVIPEADKSKVPEETKGRMQISLQENGDLFVGLIPVSLEELGRRVRHDNETIAGFRVFLRADANVSHRHVQSVMQTCAENGVFDIIFATFQE